RDLADARQRRIEAALGDILRGDEPGQRARGAHEHLVGDAARPARDYAEADTGEDVGVVALARHEGLAVELHRIVRAAAGEQRAAAGVAIGLLGAAFRLGGRVR